MRILFLASVALASGLLCSCGVDNGPRAVGPSGDAASSMPWNTPQQGEGQGMMGLMLDR